jgi:hypothetical protein
MPPLNPPLPANHQAVLDRFVAACHADSRVVAAFLRGSHVTGLADVYSDLDLYAFPGRTTGTNAHKPVIKQA